MHTKLITATSTAVGLACAYLSPSIWISSFAVGILIGKFSGNRNAYITEHEISRSMMSSIADEYPERKDSYERLVINAYPGIITAGLNLASLYVIITKIALPIIYEINTTAALIGLSGFTLGYSVEFFIS